MLHYCFVMIIVNIAEMQYAYACACSFLSCNHVVLYMLFGQLSSMKY